VQTSVVRLSQLKKTESTVLYKHDYSIIVLEPFWIILPFAITQMDALIVLQKLTKVYCIFVKISSRMCLTSHACACDAI